MISGPRMHYVPRLLLRRFTNDDGVLSVYDKQERRWFHPGVGNIGLENNIYESDVDSWVRDTMESPVGVILKRMLSGDLAISKEDLTIVAGFIIIQKFRVPAIRLLLDEDPNFLYDRLSETYDEIIERIDPTPPELIQEREYILEIAKNDPHSLVSKFPQLDLPNAALMGGMNSTDWKIRDALTNMAWRLIYAKGEEYILSDAPVYVQNSDEYNPEIVLPISKKCAIHIGIFGTGGVLNDSVECDELVRQLNSRTLTNSQRFIYASQEHNWVTENADRESFDFVPTVFDAPEVPGVSVPFIFDSEPPESEN